MVFVFLAWAFPFSGFFFFFFFFELAHRYLIERMHFVNPHKAE